MSSWVKTLLSVRSFAKASMTKFVDINAPTPATLQTKLFQDLQLLSNQKSGLKVLFNVQMAAIHLFFFASGIHSQEKFGKYRSSSIKDILIDYLGTSRLADEF